MNKMNLSRLQVENIALLALIYFVLNDMLHKKYAWKSRDFSEVYFVGFSQTSMIDFFWKKIWNSFIIMVNLSFLKKT